MTAMVRRSQLAGQDYEEIWRYVAADNPDAADRLLRRIEAKLALYAANPGMGTPRDKLLPGLRSFPIGNYLAFYRKIPEGIELVRVLHGARDLSQLIGKPIEPPTE